MYSWQFFSQQYNLYSRTAGALVYWLKEEAHNQKVVSSNPGVRYWMDIFSQFLSHKFRSQSKIVWPQVDRGFYVGEFLLRKMFPLFGWIASVQQIGELELETMSRAFTAAAFTALALRSAELNRLQIRVFVCACLITESFKSGCNFKSKGFRYVSTYIHTYLPSTSA